MSFYGKMEFYWRKLQNYANCRLETFNMGASLIRNLLSALPEGIADCYCACDLEEDAQSLSFYTGLSAAQTSVKPCESWRVIRLGDTQLPPCNVICLSFSSDEHSINYL